MLYLGVLVDHLRPHRGVGDRELSQSEQGFWEPPSTEDHQAAGASCGLRGAGVWGGKGVDVREWREPRPQFTSIVHSLNKGDPSGAETVLSTHGSGAGAVSP